LAIFQLIRTKFCIYILTKNVLGLLVICLLNLTVENSLQRNCVDNMTLNSLEMRTELSHAFD